MRTQTIFLLFTILSTAVAIPVSMRQRIVARMIGPELEQIQAHLKSLEEVKIKIKEIESTTKALGDSVEKAWATLQSLNKWRRY